MYRSDHQLEFQNYNDKITDFDLQLYQNPEGQENPVFFVREAEANQGPGFAICRGYIAAELGERFDLKVEDVRWVEQSRDGTLTAYNFTEKTQEQLPFEYDLSSDDMREAAQTGTPEPAILKNYDAKEAPVNRADFEVEVGAENSLDFPLGYSDQLEKDMNEAKTNVIDRASITPEELSAMKNQVEEQQQKQEQNMSL